MKDTATIAVICSTLLLVACQAPELPEVSKPVKRLDSDDLAVMKAVLDDFLRPERDPSIQRAMASPKPVPRTTRFLMFDWTVAVCERQPLPGAVLPGCIDDHWLRHLASATSAPTLSAATRAKKLNARSLPIIGLLADDVIYIPAGINVADLDELTRKYQSGSVIALSAPVYLEPRTALIAYRDFWNSTGFARLTRTSGKWNVASHSGSLE